MQLKKIETRRQELQKETDSTKTSIERNKLGQFSTPINLALDILALAKDYLPTNQKIRFFDPAFGMGSFYSALIQTFPFNEIEKAVGFEIDKSYFTTSQNLWNGFPVKIYNVDFTKQRLIENDKFNLIICNPPYVRHHHIPSAEKIRLQRLSKKYSGIALNGLSGLYCYFLALAHSWLKEDGIAIWLIPGEFFDVNYGGAIKDYLLNQVSLLQIHKFDPKEVQFDDALVTSTIIVFKKDKTQTDNIKLTYGGSLLRPKSIKYIDKLTLKDTNKWSTLFNNQNHQNSNSKYVKLGEIFNIKRGLVTGANDFFILTREKIIEYNLPYEFFKPILPSPRFLLQHEIEGDTDGNPMISNQYFLLDLNLPETTIKEKYPALWSYLEKGIASRINERYLCRHRRPWYSQEKREPSLFLCTYMGRQKDEMSSPFRFILNFSKAIVPNTYLMLYPKQPIKRDLFNNSALARNILFRLNQISHDQMTIEGRVYGGGLFKLEPGELASVSADEINEIIPKHDIISDDQLGLKF